MVVSLSCPQGENKERGTVRSVVKKNKGGSPPPPPSVPWIRDKDTPSVSFSQQFAKLFLIYIDSK